MTTAVQPRVDLRDAHAFTPLKTFFQIETRAFWPFIRWTRRLLFAADVWMRCDLQRNEWIGEIRLSRLHHRFMENGMSQADLLRPIFGILPRK